MTDSLLLDTHIVLWLDAGDPRLKAGTRGTIDAIWLAGGSVLVSSVTAWEIALLSDTGRISLDCPPEAWIERFLVLLCHKTGILADPLATGASVELSCEIPDDYDPDGSDGVFNVAFRPDWRSRVGGTFWVLQSF